MPGFPLRPLFASLHRMLLASVIMAETVWAVARRVGGNSGMAAVERIAAGGIVGAFVYLGMLILLRAPELDDLRRRFGSGQEDVPASG